MEILLFGENVNVSESITRGSFWQRVNVSENLHIFISFIFTLQVSNNLSYKISDSWVKL